VLGLADSHENDQQEVYEEFKEQLERNDAGWYETKLPWKGNHPTLPSNERGSKRRLDQLIRKLEKNDQYSEYNDILQDQLQKGVIEIAPPSRTNWERVLNPPQGRNKEEY
jgi:small-conductance mechanosensitive channel